MKVVLIWVSKAYPGCIGVYQEKGRNFCYYWQLYERETLCGKYQIPLIGLKKTVAKMAGKPSKTKQTSLQIFKTHWDQRGSDNFLPY